ncbi:sensor histidine kinase [Membranihabitans maritimus]|uniref:sensor histidine kinase n=1 Tax=Membranihabitans maritimus TaxID=2904244 RepID=UPI001F25C60E|nr:HAMP domain-containing sensor histidine kinase [Membranihabitans maritimus]
MQIRKKTTLQFILIVAGILITSFLYIHFQFKTSLQKEFYQNLESKALMMGKMIIDDKPTVRPLNTPRTIGSDSLAEMYKENISIFDTTGTRIYSFHPSLISLPSSIITEILKSEKHKFLIGDLNALGIKYLDQNSLPYIVVAEANFNPIHLKRLTQILYWVFFLSIILVALGGWILSHQSLRPLNRIMNQIDLFEPSNLNQRVTVPNQKDELSRLAITFNKLLERIENAFNTQKMFLSNISHELKNPLNVITSQIEIILNKDRNTEDYKKVLSSVLSDTRELNKIATKLMQLARITSDNTPVKFTPCRIDEILWQSKTQLIKQQPEYTIKLDILNLPTEESHLNIEGNEHLLKIAIINLMDNGCKFSPDKSVSVSLSYHEAKEFIVTITDTGPGISKKDLPYVRNAFYRGKRNSSIKGSGIGLALADNIFTMHSIYMNIETNQGKGTRIVLHFPLQAHAPYNHS